MTGNLLVFLGAALASAVEMVEALTIVLALGVTRGWRAPLQGAVAALVVLAVLVAALGPALEAIPIDVLRLIVGSLLLVFGLQWLRKAILRASGLKALHDEDAAFAAEVAAAEAMGVAAGRDRYSLVIAFKSTLLEGLEVAFIVITLGANQGATAVAAAGAVVGSRRRRDRRHRRPEAAEPGAREHAQVHGRRDADVVRHVLGRRGRRDRLAGRRGVTCGADRSHTRVVTPLRAAARPLAEGRDGVRGLWHGIVDFVVGDDIWIAVAVLVLLAVAAAAVHFGADAWWLLAVGVPAALWVSLQRAQRAAGKACMTTGTDDEWRRPIDPMVDSDAPDQIALELGRRHALYLREAQRIVLEGAVPDEGGLTAGDQGRDGALPPLPAVARGRRRSLRPWPASRRRTLAALRTIVATAVAAPPTPAPPPARPIRRLALQPSATIVGNMAVRKQPTERGLELAWDAAPQVIEWVLRVSVRPDPRQDYVEGEAETLPAATRSYEVELDEHPRRIQLYGHARGGKIVRRAVISALTSGNSGAQWKRQATAS